jgi:hypothetical protein
MTRRVFGGKSYSLRHYTEKKSKANALRKKWKKSGYSCRIVKRIANKKPYAYLIYVR